MTRTWTEVERGRRPVVLFHDRELFILMGTRSSVVQAPIYGSVTEFLRLAAYCLLGYVAGSRGSLGALLRLATPVA